MRAKSSCCHSFCRSPGLSVPALEPVSSTVKWAILTGEYPPQPGGVSDYTRLVASALAECGDAVTVLTGASRGETPCDPGVTVSRMAGRFGPTGLRRLSGELARLGPETRLLVQYVPQAFGWKAMNLPFGWWLRSQRHRAIDVMFHEAVFPWIPHQSWKHRLLAVMTRRMAGCAVQAADRIFVSVPTWTRWLPGVEQRNDAVRWLPVPSTLTEECPEDAVIRTIRRQRGIGESDIVIGHFGTYSHQRDLLAEVFDRLLLEGDNRHVLLTGRGSREFAEQWSRGRASLAARLHATGGLPAEQTAAHLAACDLLIQPYLDGLSTRRTSAMAGLALGLPIVSTTGAQTEPLWQDSRAVVLADVVSVGGLVEAARSLLNNSAERERLRQVARQLYLSRFALVHTVDQLRDCRLRTSDCAALPIADNAGVVADSPMKNLGDGDGMSILTRITETCVHCAEKEVSSPMSITTRVSAATSRQSSLRLKLLKTMCLAREGDRREELLLRQGKGWFQVSGAGHESLAAISLLLEDDDYLFTYYRSRAMVLARGMTNSELALAYFAKRSSSSGGRQMPGHPSSRPLNIWSVPTPTGSCLLPACGVAWGMQMEGASGVVIGTIGDAACRQGEFYEAVTFAVERQLPIVFVVEDNGYGISTNTRGMNPFQLGVFDDQMGVVHLDARHPDNVAEAAEAAIDRARHGAGPSILHCELDRLCNHTCSDDQRVYRSERELALMRTRDPIDLLARDLIDAGEITETDWEQIRRDIRDQVDRDYREAERAADPRPAEVLEHLYGPEPTASPPPLEAGPCRMVDALNRVFDEALTRDRRYVFFGQDIEDPKGGVFGLTAGLSTKFPDRVFNSPLAEATIAGVACGLACYGMKPVFELQFVDFVGPAMTQIAQNMATIRWRSFNEWPCPAILYAPYGAYLPGGSLWHSQANEALFAHTPGLRVVVPSTPADAAGLMWTAMQADDPTIFLIPKHRLRLTVEVDQIEPVPFGRAAIRREGSDVTVVAWGNCVELAEQAAERLADEVSVEVIDLRTIVPWDRDAVQSSLEKTGRLVVVQEDAQSCSVGQMIIGEVTSDPISWGAFMSPPRLVSRPDVHIGFNPIYESAALPNVDDVVSAIHATMRE